jgi:alpha-L-fucosidase
MTRTRSIQPCTPGWRRVILILAAVLVLPGRAGLSAADAVAPPAETSAQRDARMGWWRDARFGMFIHWGLYAVPAGQWKGKEIPGLGEWIMNDAKIPVKDYESFAGQFNPVKFDAEAWVGLAKAAGMKYIVITAKHCDGFAMYPSKASKYNIVDAAPFRRDPMVELSNACAAQGIKFCFYYSHCWDWHEPNAPGLINDWDFGPMNQRKPDRYFRQKSLPQVEELAARYKPALFWFDVPDLTPERSREFLAAIRRHVPDCIVNNRVGNGLGDYLTPEQEIPVNGYPGRDWETCMTINDTWGFKTHDLNFKSTKTLLRNLIDIVSKGGNYLLNVGPTAEGVIPEPEVERLKEMGRWLQINGEAIYGATAGPFKKLPWGRCTQKPGKLYLHVFDWPADGKLQVPGLKNKVQKVYLLADPQKKPLDGVGRYLELEGIIEMKIAAGENPSSGFITSEEGVNITLPPKAPDNIASVVVLEIAGPADVAPYRAPQAADGSVKLPADDAVIHGNTARYEPEENKQDIGYWTDVKDWVSWDFSISKPGEFEVNVTYACPAANAGGEYAVELDGRKLAGKVENTGGWTDFVTRKLGTVALPTGNQTISVRPVTMPGPGLMNLKRIVLKPVP